jgi:hypothetical protein
MASDKAERDRNKLIRRWRMPAFRCREIHRPGISLI